MIQGYKNSADITLLNTMYTYPKKIENSNKWTNGSMTIVYKDNVTNEKKIQEIDNPEIDYYFLKKGEQIPDYNMLFIEKDKVDRHIVPFKDLIKDIAQNIGKTDEYYDNIRNGNSKANRNFIKDTRVFMADKTIDSYYRFEFSNLYTNNIVPVSKAYFDIETDIINQTDRSYICRDGSYPINAVTIILENENKTYTLLLRNKNNPLIQEFEDSINADLFKELKDFIRDKVGGAEKEEFYKLNNMDYQFLFYNEEDEILLIQDLFNIINQYKPDFLMAWNMAFDVPYIIQRIQRLGYRPEDIICHPDFKIKRAEYFEDERHKTEFAEKGDYASISSYSVFIDQMIQYASRRKGQKTLPSFRLDFIGKIACGVRKYDYSNITTDIAKLPYLNYKVFVFYNIMDTIVQKCIEIKSGDINYLFSKCNINNTPYQKAHRQTVYLTERGRKEFFKDGFIMGNNFNSGSENPSEKFSGAFVSDPSKISDYAKMRINGGPVMLFNLLDDYDYKSLYPSICREFNVAHNTMIGKVIINNKVFENENPYKSDTFDRGARFVEDLQSHNWIIFASRWLHLATFKELIHDIKEYNQNIRYSTPLNIFTPRGEINVIENIGKDCVIECLKHYNTNEYIPCIEIYKNPRDLFNINNIV